jgi:hypothetical protein
VKINGIIEYLDATPIVFAKPQPTRQPTPSEATTIFDAVIQHYATEHNVSYNAALSSLQTEAPELITYFQSIRRQTK